MTKSRKKSTRSANATVNNRRSAGRPNNRQRSVIVQRVPRLAAMLDRAAVEWAQLLMDPCNAKLAYPCYPSGSGSTVLMRLEADSIIASGATETASFGSWIPGLGIQLQNTTPQTSDTLGSLITPGSLQPGDTFLKASATAVRCVAACLQITYPGSESSRAGVVGIGLVPAETFAYNTTTASGGSNINGTAQSQRVMCQHVERMPATVLEIKWVPGEADTTSYGYPYPTLYSQQFAGRNALAWSASGFPVNTGIRVRTVAVYEMSLTSTAASGSVQSVVPATSVTPMATILKALSDKDPQWYLSTALKTARTVGSIISYASQGVKAAGLAVNGLALMAA